MRRPDSAAQFGLFHDNRSASADAALKLHWSSFRSAELEFAVADFPAWMLMADSRPLDFVPVSAVPDDTAGQAYMSLHGLIRSAGCSARRRLHALHPALLKLYLAAVDRSRSRP